MNPQHSDHTHKTCISHDKDIKFDVYTHVILGRGPAKPGYCTILSRLWWTIPILYWHLACLVQNFLLVTRSWKKRPQLKEPWFFFSFVMLFPISASEWKQKLQAQGLSISLSHIELFGFFLNKGRKVVRKLPGHTRRASGLLLKSGESLYVTPVWHGCKWKEIMCPNSKWFHLLFTLVWRLWKG